MLKATFELKGVSDFMFGRHIAEAKQPKETHSQFEQRSWQQKVSMMPDGQCFINPFGITNGLVSAGEWLKENIPGEGKATYTKRFRCGVNPGGPILLFQENGKPITIKQVEPVLLFVPSDGKHGGPKRVDRIFPTLHQWIARGNVMIFDGKIDEKIFAQHLEALGKFVGLGSMRVQNGGINGRFLVAKLEFETLEG